MNSLLLDALECKNVQRPPVWLMRQAGRYMPQYRALRQHHTLWEMFHRPDLAAQVTMLPIDLLGVDAAILFSDILVIAECLGLHVEFPEKGGPRVIPSLSTKEQIDALPLLNVAKTLDYVMETIRRVRGQLDVPLIGFCGGPFTVATYCIDPTSKEKTLEWIEKDPMSVHTLLKKLTTVSIEYLTLQVQAGVQVVQIFDSWANVLSDTHFQEFCTPYLEQMIRAIKPLVPVIIFCRNASQRCRELSALVPSCVSCDEHMPLAELRKKVPYPIALQGNLSPELLKRPLPEIQEHVENLLSAMKGDRGFIFNLGHGVLPDIPFEHVKYLVQLIQA